MPTTKKLLNSILLLPPINSLTNLLCRGESQEVFKESKSLLFKSLRVQRIYDKERNTIVYVSFNTRLDKGDDTNNSRFKSALCAVSLGEPSSAPGVTEAAASAAAN